MDQILTWVKKNKIPSIIIGILVIAIIVF